ncbi:MAG: HD domain-containing protein [Candidatus Hodarchaeales archaeon]
MSSSESFHPPNLSFSAFFKKISSNIERGETSIKQAFEFAATQHAGQKRKFTGRIYFVHPIAVAQALKEFSDEVVIAGLLHDVIEDTDATAEEIENYFGPEVAFLVLGCTKDPSKQRSPMDILREAAAQDERVIYIKLADRYDNLGDNILNMKLKTIRKYHHETPEILELAKTYNIDFLVDSIQAKLATIAEWLATNEET